MSPLLLLVLLACQAEAAPYDFSAPVVDLADLLPPADERALSERLRAHREDSGVAVGVVILDTLGGRTLIQASHAASARLREGFAAGAPHVAIVVAPRERQLRVEIGDGLEVAFADREGDRLVAEALRSFQGGDGAGAVLGLADGIMAHTPRAPMSPVTRAVLVALAAGATVGLLGFAILRRVRRS